MLLPLQGVLHVFLVPPPVRLGPEGPDRRPLALVQEPVLDAARVGGLCHLAPQGVQLPDQMALAGAADGGVAGHVARRVQVDGEHDGLHPQPGGGQGSLNARVAGADDGDIKLSGVEFGHGKTSENIQDQARCSVTTATSGRLKRRKEGPEFPSPRVTNRQELFSA